MIAIKANASMSVIFTKLIRTMQEDVEWTKIFLIHNNNIILPGKKRSLIFNFDNRRVFGNYLDLSIDEEKAELILENNLLEDTLNLILYVFGKWGEIKGLRVEKDYRQLNTMINRVLGQIRVEGTVSEDHFRFFYNGKRSTYEEVITLILEKNKNDSKEETESEKNEENGEAEENIGLWHKIVWSAQEVVFEKRQVENTATKRLGHNFYPVKYLCAACRQNLSMTVYPEKEEYRIETQDEAVYMARVYTCGECHRFYTPWPEKMLMEGMVYEIDFEEDKNAYKDYLSLLGEKGGRRVNSHFNRYESDYNNKKQVEPVPINEAVEDLPDSVLEGFVDRIDSGFLDEKKHQEVYKKAERELEIRNKRREKNLRNKNNNSPHNAAKTAFTKSIDNTPQIIHTENTETLHNYNRAGREIITNYTKKEPEYRTDGKRQQFEKKFDYTARTAKKEDYPDIIKKVKQKNYFEVARILETYKKHEPSAHSDDSYKDFLKQLEDTVKEKGEKELDYIVSHLPLALNKEQYHKFREKLEEYRGVDDAGQYRKRLDKVYDNSERSEIESYIKKAGARDRKSILKLHDDLKKMNFSEKNVNPYLEDLRAGIYRADEEQIKKICPDPTQLSFEEGSRIYKVIEEADWLPEIKISYMDRITQRLIKIKTEESELLVRKLEKELGDIKDKTVGLHLCNIRQLLKESTDKSTAIISNALNTYAYGKGKYEFPIFAVDTTSSGNGKEGFLVTPDHIFYNGVIRSGVLKIPDIQKFFYENSLLKNGIYVILENSERVKLCGLSKLNKENIPAFLNVLNEFLQYLKEKPESRNISYLAKEKHTKICCLRCGYVYSGRRTCPKCGSTNLVP